MNRRRFLALTAATLPALHSLAEASPRLAVMRIHPDQPGPTIPANFIGLSYEVKQLSDPTFFSMANAGLIAQFRALSAEGVLRLGGNTSDIGWWKATSATQRPPIPANVVLHAPPGEKSPLELSYAITPESVVNLRAFLDATGWTCIYGINLGSSTPARAAEEAEFVAKTLGPKLEYFQIGNEPDGFHLRLRDGDTWTSAAYFDQWLETANAIRAQVPSAAFGVGDVSEEVRWLAPISDKLIAMASPPKIAAVTNHYYFTGPPANPAANLGNLLTSDPRVKRDASLVSAAAKKLNASFRMTEGNTCYQGGKPGFSDVFGATLWAADYALTLASLGYAGINLHGGSGRAVADSLGGRLLGEALMTDPKAPHPRPFYTPIAQIDGAYVAEPVFYGLKFAGAFAGATFLKLDFDPLSDSSPLNVGAFAAKLPSGHLAVAIINKDFTRSLPVHLPGYKVALTLTAPSPASTQVQFVEHVAGHEVTKVAPASAVILQGPRVSA